jgi:Caspase domain/Domain of unknown function (DUF4384)
MKRRTFLQRFGSILAVLGVTEAEWLTLGNRYYQALAQPSPRKLALLVGINQYPQSPGLSGCLTDVELQRELLIHRFGFQPADILTLTEEQASREFIENAFLDHLVNAAKPDDVVVFHFSGYGSQIKSGTLLETTQNALVPADEAAQSKQIVNLLLEETLLLLLRSLPTERVTAVLDTSYTAESAVRPMGMRIRARQMPLEAQLAAAEVDFLLQLKNQLASKNLTSTPDMELSNAVVLASTSQTNQLAREILMSGFSAGLFTYALTQYLWEASPAKTIQITLKNVESSIHKLGGKQQPALLSNQKNQVRLRENFQPNRSIGAEGVITEIEEDSKVRLWLGGIPPQVLENYGVHSQFSLLDTELIASVRSRTGLTAKAQITNIEDKNSLQIGQLIQEKVRALSRNINLTVALDTGLERIERVDAISAFATVARVSSTVAGEQPADYVFGRIQQTPSRYGLFSLASEPIANTAGEAGEAVKVAIQRFAPKLPTLLAAKLWRLTENEGSSRLSVKATLEIVSSLTPRVVMQRETVRTLSTQDAIYRVSTALNTSIVPIGSRIQYRVQNTSDRPIYLMLVGLNTIKNAIAFYPWQSSQQPNATATKPLLKHVVVASGETLTIPQAAAANWVIPGPAAECEHQLICSTAPFTQTLAALAAAKYPTAEQQPISVLSNPLEVAQALLQDLHNASIEENDTQSTTADYYLLNVNNWASFSFIYQVV